MGLVNSKGPGLQTLSWKGRLTITKRRRIVVAVLQLGASKFFRARLHFEIARLSKLGARIQRFISRCSLDRPHLFK